MRLIRDTVSHDVVEALEQLTELARLGELTGIVFGCSIKGRRYMVDAAGTFARDPTLGRGVIAALDDELQHMVQSRADSSTTL